MGAEPPGDCPNKGNINRDDVRIYHLPGSRRYDRTRISPEKGEHWFRTEAGVREAEWRAAR